LAAGEKHVSYGNLRYTFTVTEGRCYFMAPCDSGYELVYGLGGHGGPVQGSRNNAVSEAIRMLMFNQPERVIYVVPRSAPHFNQEYASDIVRKSEG
jgi:hypothetical protein